MSRDTEKTAPLHPPHDAKPRGAGESSALSSVEPPSLPRPVSLRWAYLLIVTLSLALGVSAIVRGTSGVTSNVASDLSNFFLKSAAAIARGDPWRLYAIRADRPFQTYPNDGTPLALFLMAPLLGLARALGGARATRGHRSRSSRSRSSSSSRSLAMSSWTRCGCCSRPCSPCSVCWRLGS